MQLGVLAGKRDMIWAVSRGSDVSATESDHSAAAPEGGRAIGVSIAVAAGLLALACGLLWARFGTQVFLDAAETFWKTCF